MLLLAFVGITMSAQSLKWYNPQEAGFHVLQGQAFEGEVRKRFYDRHGNEEWLAAKYSFKDTVTYSYSDDLKPGIQSLDHRA